MKNTKVTTKNKRMFGIAVAAAAWFAIGPVPFDSASASTITGQISVFGTINLDLSGQTISFLSGNQFSPTATAPGDPNTVVVTQSGDFLNLGTGGLLTWRNQGNPIAFSSIGNGSDLACGPTCLFTGSNNGLTSHSTFSRTPRQTPCHSSQFSEPVSQA
jgi:hypothetical protein